MTRKHLYRILGLAVVALTVATAASAAGPVTGDFKQTYKMITTADGAQFGATGYVQIWRSNGVEGFAVRLFARMPDRSNLTVEVWNDQGQFEVGAFELLLGSGSLERIASRDPSPVFPLSAITRAEVRDSHGLVLVEFDFPVFQPAPAR